MRRFSLPPPRFSTSVSELSLRAIPAWQLPYVPFRRPASSAWDCLHLVAPSTLLQDRGYVTVASHLTLRDLRI